MERGGCVCILTNYHHTVSYTGVTSDLLARVFEHKIKSILNHLLQNIIVINLFFMNLIPALKKPSPEKSKSKIGKDNGKLI
jgi:putative endonuclease